MKQMIREYLEIRFGTEEPVRLTEFCKECRINMADGISVLKRLPESGDYAAPAEKSRSSREMIFEIPAAKFPPEHYCDIPGKDVLPASFLHRGRWLFN